MEEGVIRNIKTGFEIPGQMMSTSVYGVDGFNFRIAETQSPNSFHWRDWTFTPEVPPLPELTGSVIEISFPAAGSSKWMLCFDAHNGVKRWVSSASFNTRGAQDLLLWIKESNGAWEKVS